MNVKTAQTALKPCVYIRGNKNAVSQMQIWCFYLFKGDSSYALFSSKCE